MGQLGKVRLYAFISRVGWGGFLPVVHFGTSVKWIAVMQKNSAHGNGRGMLTHASKFQASICSTCTNILVVETKLGEGVWNGNYSTPLGKY